jgi:hypothetical protein
MEWILRVVANRLIAQFKFTEFCGC